ncbi:MAG: hypothetical protein SGPRY_013700, partial [Prymnesium sp.]
MTKAQKHRLGYMFREMSVLCGDTIQRRGHPSTHVFVVFSGELRVVIDCPSDSSASSDPTAKVAPVEMGAAVIATGRTVKPITSRASMAALANGTQLEVSVAGEGTLVGELSASPVCSVSLFGASASATVLYASRDEFFARISKDVSKVITRVYSEQLAGWHRRYVSLLSLVENDFPAREVKKPTLSRPASAAARTCYSQRGKLAGRENLLLRQQSGEERATCDPSSPRMSTRARRVVEETTRVVYDRDRRQYVDAVRIKYNPPAQPCEGSQLRCSPLAHRAKPALFGARSKPKKLLLVCPPQRRQVTG